MTPVVLHLIEISLHVGRRGCSGWELCGDAKIAVSRQADARQMHIQIESRLECPSDVGVRSGFSAHAELTSRRGKIVSETASFCITCLVT